MYTPENDLLLKCSRVSLSEHDVQQIQRLASRKVDWTNLVLMAGRHGVLPLLNNSLNQACPHEVPPQVLDRLGQNFSVNALHNLLLAKQLRYVLSFLSSQHISAIPFKGPVLAASAYTNLAFRQMSDLDILVSEQDHERAVALLREQGYQQTVDVPWESHLHSPDGSYSIDLHRDLVPRHLFCFDEADWVWEQVRSIDFYGVQIQVLSPEIELLVICLNGNKERWQRLNRICDVAELVRAHPNMRWSWLMSYARNLGCQRLLLLGLQLANNFLDIPLPLLVKQSIGSDRTITTLTAEVSDNLFVEHLSEPGEVQRTVFHIRSRERLRDKFRSWTGLMDHSGWLTPTENDQDFIHLPSSLAFLYYAVRPLRIINKYYFSQRRG